MVLRIDLNSVRDWRGIGEIRMEITWETIMNNIYNWLSFWIQVTWSVYYIPAFHDDKNKSFSLILDYFVSKQLIPEKEKERNEKKRNLSWTMNHLSDSPGRYIKLRKLVSWNNLPSFLVSFFFLLFSFFVVAPITAKSIFFYFLSSTLDSFPSLNDGHWIKLYSKNDVIFLCFFFLSFFWDDNSSLDNTLEFVK